MLGPFLHVRVDRLEVDRTRALQNGNSQGTAGDNTMSSASSVDEPPTVHDCDGGRRSSMREGLPRAGVDFHGQGVSDLVELHSRGTHKKVKCFFRC